MQIWRRAVSSRPLFAVNVADWFIGAAGLDGKILGWMMHPAIAISIISISSVLIFEHLRDRYYSNRLYGNPLVKLNLSDNPVRQRREFPRLIEGISNPNPPEITPRGGEDFSLELRANTESDYYGYGWLSGEGVTRTRKFDLEWIGSRRVETGDVAVVRIAEIDRSYAQLIVWGDTGRVVHHDRTWSWWSDTKWKTDWLQIRVELRARGAGKTWKRFYRFRLVKETGFEVEEVQG